MSRRELVNACRLWPGAAAFRFNGLGVAPKDLRVSISLLIAVGALVQIQLILGVVAESNAADDEVHTPYFLTVLLGVALIYGASQLRAGHPWSRVFTAVVASVLGLMLVKGIVNCSFLVHNYLFNTDRDYTDPISYAAYVGIYGALLACILGLTASGTVFMFRDSVTQHIASQSMQFGEISGVAQQVKGKGAWDRSNPLLYIVLGIGAVIVLVTVVSSRTPTSKTDLCTGYRTMQTEFQAAPTLQFGGNKGFKAVGDLGDLADNYRDTDLSNEASQLHQLADSHLITGSDIDMATLEISRICN